MLEAKPEKVGRQPKQLKRRMRKVVARRFGPQLWLTRPWHAQISTRRPREKRHPNNDTKSKQTTSAPDRSTTTSTSESSPSPPPGLSCSSISNTSNKSAIFNDGSSSSAGPASSAPAVASSPSFFSGLPWASALSSFLAHASSPDPSKGSSRPAFFQLKQIHRGPLHPTHFSPTARATPLMGVRVTAVVAHDPVGDSVVIVQFGHVEL